MSEGPKPALRNVSAGRGLKDRLTRGVTEGTSSESSPEEESLWNFKWEVQARVVEALASGPVEPMGGPIKRALRIREEIVRQFAVVGGEWCVDFSVAAHDILVQDLLDEIVGFGPFERLLRDHAVTEIEADGPRRIFVVRHGKREPADIRLQDNKHLLGIIRRIIEPLGRVLDMGHPQVTATLPDGTTITATTAPLSPEGPTLHIQRPPQDP